MVGGQLTLYYCLLYIHSINLSLHIHVQPNLVLLYIHTIKLSLHIHVQRLARMEEKLDEVTSKLAALQGQAQEAGSSGVKDEQNVKQEPLEFSGKRPRTG